MSFKAIAYSIGCMLAWFVLLPIMVVGGGLSVFAYATFAELASVVRGKSSQELDPSTAREMARRMCLSRRLPISGGRVPK